MKTVDSFISSYRFGRERKDMIVELLSRQGQSLADDCDIKIEFLDLYRDLCTKRLGNRSPPAIDNWALEL